MPGDLNHLQQGVAPQTWDSSSVGDIHRLWDLEQDPGRTPTPIHPLDHGLVVNRENGKCKSNSYIGFLVYEV